MSIGRGRGGSGAENLNYLANAIRAVLDMDPLPSQDGRTVGRPKDVLRFATPYHWPGGRTNVAGQRPKVGSGS